MQRAPEPKTERREDITRALYRCICRQGYAATTLSDIATEAGMSPSHVGYYFDNRGAILEHYAAELCQQILEGLPDLAEPDTERLIDAIAHFCFGEGQQNMAFGGVIQEVTGLAVHDIALRRIKTRHSTAWRSYLEAFYERTLPVLGLTAVDAARTVHAIVVGLGTNLLFDPDLTRQGAHDLLRDVLRRFAGFDSRAPALASGAHR